MPRTAEDDTSKQLHKKKNQRKIFEKNKNHSLNVSKCKLKEIKRPASGIITVQNSSAPLPLILRREQIPCIIKYLQESQNLNFSGKSG